MATATVSDKYQIVIPKKARERVKIKKRQKLNFYVLGDGIFITPQKQWPDDYIGSQKDIWGKIDVKQYIEDERNSWD